MATKLAETMNKTNNYSKTFYIFSKNCVSSLSVTSTNLECISVLFFFPFYNVYYRYKQLFKIFRSGQKQQTTQSTARADNWKPRENAKSWLVQKWYHTCVDKNGIATGESGDIIFLILLPFGIQLYFIW